MDPWHLSAVGGLRAGISWCEGIGHWRHRRTRHLRVVSGLGAPLADLVGVSRVPRSPRHDPTGDPAGRVLGLQGAQG